MTGEPDPTRRFSGRAADYARHRPGYPAGVLELVREEIGLEPSWAVADVGSGTGFSAQLFLDHGNRVFGVEPNAEMRALAERSVGDHPRFESVEGTAEATTLPAGSVGLVVAAQAFHWFDVEAARREFTRILRPGGWVLLMWNARRSDTTPFLRAYEELLRRFGTDYGSVRRSWAPGRVGELFGGPYQERQLYNEQLLDLEGLRGRLLSSSYVPGPSHRDHSALLSALERIFREHQEGGRVRLEYDVELYFGRLGPSASSAVSL